MDKLTKFIEVIGEKAYQLKELRASSPEIAAALDLADEYHQLVSQLEEQCKQPALPVLYPVPYPVPVYPSYPRPMWYYDSRATFTPITYTGTATVSTIETKAM